MTGQTKYQVILAVITVIAILTAVMGMAFAQPQADLDGCFEMSGGPVCMPPEMGR